jgi:hypothetical protein
MKKWFYWVEVVPIAAQNSNHVFEGLFDVIADSEASAKFALDQRIALELPKLRLVKAELVFSRCESLTEFIRKAA